MVLEWLPIILGASFPHSYGLGKGKSLVINATGKIAMELITRDAGKSLNCTMLQGL